MKKFNVLLIVFSFLSIVFYSGIIYEWLIPVIEVFMPDSSPIVEFFTMPDIHWFMLAFNGELFLIGIFGLFIKKSKYF